MPEPADSYSRCVSQAAFIERFHQNFFKSNPAIPPLFQKTDIKRQKDLLRQGIAMMIMWDSGNEVAKQALERLADIHGPRGMKIVPALYPLWTESLIASVKEHDPKFSPEVEKRWHETLDRAMGVFLRRYQ